MKKRKWLFKFIWQYRTFFIARIHEYSLLNITLKYSWRYDEDEDKYKILGITFYFIILGIGFSIGKKIGKW